MHLKLALLAVLLHAQGTPVHVAPAAPASLPAQEATDGEVVTTWPDGAVKERYRLDGDGRKHGRYESFNEDGSPDVVTVFAKGKEHGTREVFEGGVLRSKRKLRYGVLDGPMVDFDAAGRPVRTAKYRRGVLHGKLTELRPDEKWKRTVSLKAGVPDGKGKIEVRGKAVSRRKWKAGTLVDLDGIEAFPTPLATLRSELEEALEVPELDPSDPMSAMRLKELARLQQYRALCGVPFRGMELVPEWNALCDAAAVLLDAHGKLDHTPPKPPGFDDEAYRRGFLGTSKSNLHTGPLGRTVDGYMDDSDRSNIDRVGHRRWCLNPAMGKTAFGGNERWSAMWSMDDSRAGKSNIDAVHYPPRGFTPVSFFAPHHAWSIQVYGGPAPPPAGALEIQLVELDPWYQAVGEPLELEDVRVDTQGFAGGPCIIFRPKGLKVSPGRRYRATVSKAGAKEPRYDYVVEFVEG